MNRIGCCVSAGAVALLLAGGCGSEDRTWECQQSPGASVEFVREIGCITDFEAVSSEPFNASIPGARSAKTVIDRIDGNALFFQNSRLYGVHYEFVSAHRSGDGLPFVPDLSTFNITEYNSPDRRFLLGAVTYYEGPGKWVYEISPYDTASAEMIETAYALIAEHSYFGDELYFHPTSDAVEVEAAKLPADVKICDTDCLFADIDYQPLNLGKSMGQLRFYTPQQLETEYVGFRDIVVLEAVPNDISVTSGIITADFQTPLSHINVLSQNRGTPNMSLRGAFANEQLRALEGKWVELHVGPFEFEVSEVTKEQADAWWETNKPDAVQVPAMDTETSELLDIEDMLELEPNFSNLGDELARRIPAYGGKASHFGAFAHMGESYPAGDRFPYPKAFGIPVYYYLQHMEENGLNAMVDDMLADPAFQSDPQVRDQRLQVLRDAIKAAPLNAEFEQLVMGKLAADYPGVRMRFRSSTNAEDLDGFTGAGLYTSKSGDPNDPTAPVADAIRQVWASVWFFRAFEERDYRSIEHRAVGMALLVHRSFPDEEANGVAITANIFSKDNAEPGFYINVQVGDVSIVQPPNGVVSDQFIYFYSYPSQPTVFLAHSSLVAEGETVLTRAQTYQLGQGLKTVHDFFLKLYGSSGGFYAMDVEFKFDGEPGQEPQLYIKQARPHPGWGLEGE